MGSLKEIEEFKEALLEGGWPWSIAPDHQADLIGAKVDHRGLQFLVTSGENMSDELIIHWRLGVYRYTPYLDKAAGLMARDFCFR